VAEGVRPGERQDGQEQVREEGERGQDEPDTAPGCGTPGRIGCAQGPREAPQAWRFWRRSARRGGASPGRRQRRGAGRTPRRLSSPGISGRWPPGRATGSAAGCRGGTGRAPAPAPASPAGCPPKRGPAGQQLIQNTPRAVDVGGKSRSPDLPVGLLRGHVARVPRMAPVRVRAPGGGALRRGREQLGALRSGTSATSHRPDLPVGLLGGHVAEGTRMAPVRVRAPGGGARPGPSAAWPGQSRRSWGWPSASGGCSPGLRSRWKRCRGGGRGARPGQRLHQRAAASALRSAPRCCSRQGPSTNSMAK